MDSIHFASLVIILLGLYSNFCGLGFHEKFRFTFPGIREIKNVFSGIPGISAEIFILFALKFLLFKTWKSKKVAIRSVLFYFHK